jgi:precorrin-6B C5,15-methyltransferase / cobalt-precorrin-6B C5,C15-methyltransferase
MMAKWVSIIGMGDDGFEGLTPRAALALHHVTHIVGSRRLLSYLPKLKAELHEWPQPFSDALARIEPLRGQPTAILATGDPMNYGVARKLLERIPKGEVEIIPHVGAFSLAAAHMGWSLPDCDSLTLHGRDAANIETFIQPDVRLLVLTADETTIPVVCERLTRRGFGKSEISVLENLGGKAERATNFTAGAMPVQNFSPLNTIAIHCKASADAKVLSRVPGLPDDTFMHDGKITKRELRASAIAALSPAPDQLLWDVGAGCGSIAIEWMRCCRGGEAIAFEQADGRLAMIANNADMLGTPRLRIIAGAAPVTFASAPPPDAVFIGGGMSVPGLVEAAWERLKPGGRFVAHAVTIEGEMHLYDWQASHGGELTRMEVSTLHAIGPYRAMKPRMAVTQLRIVKPWP